MVESRDYWHSWGFDRAGMIRDLQAQRQRRDAEFFEKWGYFPSQAGQARQAQDEAEKEWRQLVSELEGRMGEVRGSEDARRLQEYYGGVMGGTDLPFDERTLAGLISRTTDPMTSAARSAVERLRESFAARGLSRSGGMGSLESRYLTDAATRGAAEAGRLRGEARLSNYGARERAAGGLQGLYGSQQEMLNSLQSELARLRAARSYGVESFTNRPGENRTTPTTGGYSTKPYSPPPPLERRRTGRTPPRYDYTGAYGYTGTGGR